VHTRIHFHDAEKALRLFEEHLLGTACPAENKDDLIITKYYVKTLIQFDEYQLSLEPKNAFARIKQAEKLDRTVLVTKHKHKKETIRIQLTKMREFRQFLTLEDFKQLTTQATRTHMKKREMSFVLKFVAVERSERGDFQEALKRVNRAEQLSLELLKSEESPESLAARLEKVNVLLKMHKFGEDSQLKEIAQEAKSALELASKLYG
jgi:hypothetical protein